MQEFTNDTLDLSQLPKHESIVLASLHPNYWKVMLIQGAVFFALLAVGCVVAIHYIEALTKYQSHIWTGYAIVFLITLFFTRLSFNKKAFAFREHDVIFRHGVIATTTMIIPYNRVQHVAVHEGLIERWFGLANVEVFTAGGTASDLEIPGIDKAQAEDIKQLLMIKIQKQL